MVNPTIMSASEIVDQWGLNLALYGPPGVGKTKLISTAQDYEASAKLLIIDVEGGTRTIKDRTDISVTKPKTWKELQELYNWILKEGKNEYKTIALDTMTHAQTLCLSHVLGKKEKPEFQDFGRVGILMSKMIQGFVSLSKEDGINIIFSCHVRTDKDSQGTVYNISPDCYPKVGKALMSQVDTIGYYTKKRKGSKVNRVLQIDSAGAIKAKHRTTTKTIQELINPSFKDILEIN